MSATTEARLSELDRVVDAVKPTAALGDELFALVDVIDSQPSLRRLLTDPSVAEHGLDALVASVFGGKVSAAAQEILTQAAKRRWAGASGLAAAVERQGVRSVLAEALRDGRLDRVEDELFRFSRVVDAERPLRAALGNASVPLAGRQQLVADLLGAKADPITVALAKRAVAARRRTFDLTVSDYLNVAAQLRARSVAKVVVARPLSETQTQRLGAALTQQLGHPVSLQVTVDPDVLGGVRVTLGDDVIEGTVGQRLTDAERQIS